MFYFSSFYLIINCKNKSCDKLASDEIGEKIGGRSINSRNDDTILQPENSNNLKRPLRKVKEESEKAGLQPNIRKSVVKS